MMHSSAMDSVRGRLPLVAVLSASAALLVGGALAAQQTRGNATNVWQMMLQADIDSAVTIINQHYIYASYPSAAAWDSVMSAALAQVRREMPLVKDFAGYRAFIGIS